MIKKTIILLVVFSLIGLVPVMLDAAKEKPVSKEAQKKIKEADKAMKANDFDKAEALWQEIIEIEPEVAAAYFGLAFIQRSRNQIDDAVENFAKVLSLKPDYQNALENFNDTLYREAGKMMQTGKAAKSNEFLLQLLNHPLNTDLPADLLIDVNYKVGANYFSLRKYAESLEYMKKVEAAGADQPNYREYYVNAIYINGLNHGALKNVAEANEYLKKFIELHAGQTDNPFLPLANYILASVNFEALKEETDKFDKKLEDVNTEIDKLNQDTRIRPRDREAKANELKEKINTIKKEKIAVAKAGEAGIMPYARRAVELKDDLVDAWVIIGNFQYLCHDLDAALETYKNLIAKFPNADDINAYKAFLRDIEKEKAAEAK